MASLSKDKKIAFYLNGKKKSFRVTKLNNQDAERVASKVEDILSCRAANRPLTESLERWLAGCERWLVQSMANAGLCNPPADFTVVEYFEMFLAENKHQAKDWQKNHLNTLKIVKRHFGDELRLQHVDADLAQNFRDWMAREGKPVAKDKPKQGYAQATVAGHIKICRKVFKAAMAANYIYSNPFANVEAGSQANSDRQHEIDRETLQKLIDAAPNAPWRLLILLVRIGGMRTGSETRALRWADVDFVKRTINVPGAKAQKRNQDGSRKVRWRKIPLFPELLEPLQDCFDPSNEFVLQEITGSDANVYNAFQRIVKKAKLTAWPRLWHNLRASRDSELSASGLSDFAVAQLMGNSPDVSREHYKFIPKDVFEALKGLESSGQDSNLAEVGLPVGMTGVETGRRKDTLIQLFPGIYLDPEEYESTEYTPEDSNL